jgi:atypical dual specificity phosphatase
MYNSIVIYMSSKYSWFNRVDRAIVLGALPFRSQTKQLVEGEGVRGVISVNEPFELQYFTNSSQEWFRLGVQHKHVIVTDRTAPEVGSIEECVRMIEDLSSRKHSVYVHCKAGKGRSATVVACYLLKEYGMQPQEAIDFLRSKRPQVKINKAQMATINLFYKLYIKGDRKVM